ncbi:MAG: type II toxin-antitoxin system Phd/YefM family antitoxin [Actinobacteria bacterium]|nr:type II toxin-antitoxin system Phd/YefM family antitoxin [Actinomycetota bacterium]
MKTISLSQARNNLVKLIDKAKAEPIVIESDGKHSAVLISTEQFEKFLDAQEELEDIAAIEEAMRDSEPSIPWETVKKDLGI